MIEREDNSALSLMVVLGKQKLYSNYIITSTDYMVLPCYIIYETWSLRKGNQVMLKESIRPKRRTYTIYPPPPFKLKADQKS